MFECADFTNIDPLIWTKENFIRVNRINSPFQFNDNIILAEEENEWQDYLKTIQETVIPPAFVNLFDCKSKDEQIKVLKNEILTPKQFRSLVCYAGIRFGYKLSKYTAYHYPNIFQEKKWPKTFYIKDDRTIYKIGDTNLSDAQLIQIIAQRKIVMAKILELDESWHCFYYTDKSISDKENYGSSHMHYISNYWTIPKNDIINELSKRNYKFNGVHLDYQTHRTI